MKKTPKSCGCRSCRIGRGSKSGQMLMKSAERSYRHKAKIAINSGKEDVSIVPYSTYTD